MIPNKNIMFFDTETTGLVNRKLPHTDPKQPMPVQMGIKIDDSERVERAALNYCVRTEGWKVSAGAFKTTGIDNAIADRFGCDLITGVEMYLDMLDSVDTVVAHNISFDEIVIRRAVYLYHQKMNTAYYDPFEGKKLICTMLASTPIVKAMPIRNGQYKWPKLEECMKFFFDEDLDGAHDALVDVRGCARVYYELQRRGAF